ARPPRLVEIAGDPACPRSMFVDDAVVVGANGGLANVFVAVESLEIHPNWWDLQQGSRERPVEVTISGCRARPRAVGLMFGQPLFVANGDAVLHDLFLPATLQIWVPPAASARREDLSVSGLVRLDSDLPPWMHVAIGKAMTPFFALTGADGSFALENVPAGSWPLRVEHERYGAKSLKVVVSAGAVASVDVSFAARAARDDTASDCSLLSEREVPPFAARPASARSLSAS